MREFINNFGSLAWWLSVVFVGIALNIVSSYLKTHLDGFLATISISWKTKSAQRNRIRLEKLEYLAAHPSEQSYLAAQETRLRLQTIMFMLSALCLLIFALMVSEQGHKIQSLILKILSAIVLFLSHNCHLDAMRVRKLFYDSRNSKFQDY